MGRRGLLGLALPDWEGAFLQAWHALQHCWDLATFWQIKAAEAGLRRRLAESQCTQEPGFTAPVSSRPPQHRCQSEDALSLRIRLVRVSETLRQIKAEYLFSTSSCISCVSFSTRYRVPHLSSSSLLRPLQRSVSQSCGSRLPTRLRRRLAESVAVHAAAGLRS